MRRDIIRFPVGPQFREILEDDHEWLVITNLHLKPLIMKRGEKDSISSKLAENAYTSLKRKMPKEPNAVLRVYDLHTHPSGMKYPSPSDMRANQYNLGWYSRAWHTKKIKQIGFGVITKEGIFIVKYPPQNLQWSQGVIGFAGNYHYNFMTKLREKYGKKTSGELHEFLDKEIEDPIRRKEIMGAQVSTFKKMIKEEPDIRTKTVRRTHRFNMRRRR